MAQMAVTPGLILQVLFWPKVVQEDMHLSLEMEVLEVTEEHQAVV